MIREMAAPLPLQTGVPARSQGARAASLGVVAMALALLPGNAVTQRVLWVDDSPDRNQQEITALRQLGFAVHTAVSNEQAAERLRAGRYAVLISDMRRKGEEGLAGLRLPTEVTTDRNRLPPVVYYVSKVESPRTAEGYPVTSRPRELLATVLDVVSLR
jgi:CheY-like chemotaxis protein